MSFWTDERREDVKRRWLAGESATQICNEIGAVSRNAIIGIVNRLGLGGQRRKAAPPRILAPGARRKTSFKLKPEPKKVVLKPQMEVRAAPPVEAEPFVAKEADVRPLNFPLSDLYEWTCKFPYGERAPFSFCGHPTVRGPYCKAHAQLCNQPISERRQNDANKHSLWHAQRAG